MAIVTRNTLLGYLNCSELVSKWTNILDSFRHKTDSVSFSDITSVVITPSLLSNDLKKIIDLGDVSGSIDLDWSLAIKYRMNLVGDTIINQLNFLPYEGVKIQEIEMKSNDPNFSISWNQGVQPQDFTQPIEFTTGAMVNNVSIRLLRPNGVNGYFQSDNFIK
jgi:hypothetical protein